MDVHEKTILMVQPDEMQRMLLEIWLFRTPFKVTHTLKDPEGLAKIVKNGKIDVVIIPADLKGYSPMACFYALVQLNAKGLLLCPKKAPPQLASLLKTSRGTIECIEGPFTQAQLIGTLEKLYAASPPIIF